MSDLHSSLTGTDLHEPKGVASASAATVYCANGIGSGDWKKITSDMINGSSIKTFNTRKFALPVEDLTAGATVVLPIVENCTLTKVTVMVNGAFATSDIVLTVLKNVSTIGTGTLVQSTAVKGTSTTITCSANTLVAGTDLVEVDASGATGGVGATLVFEFSIS